MTRMRKPMLSVTGLIEHMQSKNITFNIMTVDGAKEYLEKNNNYFKLTSYRKNYSKFTSGKCEGQYENLDFAFLIELARIDVLLRKTILGMCLDIEHFLKVKLIKGVEDDPEQDGYTIVEGFLKTEAGQQANRSIIRKNNNPYCGDLIKAYQDEMPIWAFVEVISFGSLLSLAKYAAATTTWEMPVDYISLDKVRQIRNAAAHNNCIINDLNTKQNAGTPPRHITEFVADCGLSKTVRGKKMSNQRFAQMMHMLYVYDKIVQSENSRNQSLAALKKLVNERMLEHKDYFESNSVIKSTYMAFRTVVNHLA